MNHEYSYEDLEKKLDSSKGRTLGELDKTGVFPCAVKRTGVAGDVVEQSVLEYGADTRQAPDIIVDGEEWEVKTTGLVNDERKTKSEKFPYRAKERMTITALSPSAIVEEEFSDSHFWRKAKRILIFWYLYNGGKNEKVPDSNLYADFVLMDHIWWDSWTDDDVEILKRDWEEIRDYISGSIDKGIPEDEAFPGITKIDSLYLDNAPAWKRTPRRNPRFGLKKSVVDQIFIQHYTNHPLEELAYHSYGDIEKKCRDLRDELGGRTVAELAKALGYEGSISSKACAESIVVRMLGGKAKKMSGIDVFAKAGIRCKTITVTEKGCRTEDIKICPYDFAEAADENSDWEESAARDWLKGRILWVVFKEPSHEAPLSDNRFLGFKWLDDESEEILETEARRTWTEAHEIISEGKLTYNAMTDKKGNVRIAPKTQLPMHETNLPKSKDHTVFLRGSGLNASDKSVTVCGFNLYRHNLWVKGSWLASRLADVPFI